jgi:hypothetical protein
MLTYNSVAEIFEAIDRTRDGLRGTLDGLSPEQEALRDTPERWSVAEVVEHLAIIEERVGQLAGLVVQKAEGEGSAAKDSFPTIDLRAAAEQASRQKYEAPEMARPRGGASVADSLARLGRSRAALHALRPRIEALDLTPYPYPHPAFGPLDLYHWLAFIGIHEERHRRQIEGLKNASAA